MKIIFEKNNFKPIYCNIEANEIWKAEVNADQERFDFIDKMINIPDTLPVIPRTVREIINDSPFVWVIFAYDSSNKDLYPGFSLKLEYHFFKFNVNIIFNSCKSEPGVGAVGLIPIREEKNRVGSSRPKADPRAELISGHRNTKIT